MIKVYNDIHGNVTGFWDMERNCWVKEASAIQNLDALDEVLEEANTGSDHSEGSEVASVDPNAYTKAQLAEALTAAGIDFPKSASKQDLVNLYVAAQS
jgi:hypothetical protein